MFFREIIFYIIFYLWTIIYFTIFSAVFLFSVKFTSKISFFWSKSVIYIIKYILRINYKIEGSFNLKKQPAIIASNHQSAWETFFFYTLFENPIYILKKELNKIPILSFYFKKLGFIYVDRKMTFKTSKNILTKINNNEINNKRTIVIFPEGTRTSPGEKNNLGTGVFLLYKYLNLPIITIRHNSGSFWLNQKIKKNIGTINLEVFPAIQPGKKKENVMNIIENYLYKNQSGKF